METIITALMQLLLLSLLVERVIDVFFTVLKLLPAQRAAPDEWGIAGTVLGFVLGMIICFAYGFDLVKTTTSANANQNAGLIITALVIAGGSAGVSAIIGVLRTNIKASKAEALARLLHARLRVDFATDAAFDVDAGDPGFLCGWPAARLAPLTPLGDRAAKAARLHDAQGVYRRGCSEFVCAVLGVAYEQANDLMGDDPTQITDWNAVTPGSIVGWITAGGSGHVSVYVKDGISTFIDVRAPASNSVPDPKPRRLSSYGNQQMYLSSRFGS